MANQGRVTRFAIDGVNAAPTARPKKKQLKTRVLDAALAPNRSISRRVHNSSWASPRTTADSRQCQGNTEFSPMSTHRPPLVGFPNIAGRVNGATA
jgi:hypothetical protein